MMIDIYRGGAVNQSVKVDDNSKYYHKLLGQRNITLDFVDNQANGLALGDYVVFEGNNYYLNLLPEVKKVSRQEYRYRAVFESILYHLGKAQYLNIDSKGDFYLMGNADTFLTLLISNLNRVFGASYFSKGSVVSTDYRNLSFSANNCLEVLQRICNEYAVEYSFNGTQISLVTSVGSSSGATFRYGKGKGLYSLTRRSASSQNLITRLYAFGSKKNLTSSYRNYSQRLMFESGGNNYIEQNIATYGLQEGVRIFENIYPHRTGTITSVHATDITKFYDTGMDFDLNDYLLPGVEAVLHFQSGDLAGYGFKISAYNNTTQEFTLIKNTDEKAYELPNDTLKPAVGDTYVLFDISLPASYISAAETELLNAATSYLSEYSSPRVTYSLIIDPKYIEENSISFEAGDTVTIVDSELGINKEIRVVAVSRSMRNPNDYSVVISDEPVSKEWIVKVNNSLASLQRDITNAESVINPVDVKISFNDLAKAVSEANTALGQAAAALTAAESKIQMFYQDTEPEEGMNEGDIWIDTDDGNKIYVYNNSTWTESQDDAIATAIQAAADAQATADGKVTTFFQDSEPTAEAVGDLWYNTSTGVIYRWNGTDWSDSVADQTQTVIDGGVVTTGNLIVKNATEEQGGIAGTVSSGSTAIGLWLGSTFANRATAPFRVTHGGVLNAIAGIIGGWSLASDGIYTGTKHTSDGYSTSGITLASNGSIHATSFYINTDGSMGITGASIKTASTGERIEILSSTGYIAIYDGANNLDLIIGLNPIGKMPYIFFKGAVQDSYLDNTEINFGNHTVLSWGGVNYETQIYYNGDIVAKGDAQGLLTLGTVLDSTPYADHEAKGTKTKFTVGEALVFGDVCYMNSSGKMVKADADGTGTYPAWAMCLETVAADSEGYFLLQGIVRDDSFPTMTVGGVIYLSTTAGAITTTQPSGSGNKVQVLGRCTHADRIWFNPSNDYFTVS